MLDKFAFLLPRHQAVAAFVKLAHGCKYRRNIASKFALGLLRLLLSTFDRLAPGGADTQREVPRLLENPLQPLRFLQLRKVPNVEFGLDDRALIRPGLLGPFFPIGERGAWHNAFCGVGIALEHP